MNIPMSRIEILMICVGIVLLGFMYTAIYIITSNHYVNPTFNDISFWLPLSIVFGMIFVVIVPCWGSLALNIDREKRF